jgi:predicted nucleic acid-binding protein
MAVRLLLDTNAILYLLGGRLADPLPRGEQYVSDITELKLLSYPSLNPEEERRIRELLADVSVIGVTEPVKEGAIRLRRAHGLRLPDAIVAATAMSLGAELVTNDVRLARTPGLRCRPVRLRP